MLQVTMQAVSKRQCINRAAQSAVALLFAFLPFQAVAESFVAPKGVIELFTSQGCRSCPPADHAFEQLVRQGNIVALSYHVDYWNYLGWADTLGTPENTERQYAYAKTFGRSGVYTPQAVLNGRDHLKGTDATEINRRLEGMRSSGQGLVVPVKARQNGDQLAISVGSGIGKANVVVVYFREHQTVEMLKGENVGKSMDYWHSVTDVQTVGIWNGKPLDITLPARAISSDKSDGCAVLLQSADEDGNPSDIVGATVMMGRHNSL
nr:MULTISPECIES: thioredoxin family protein [unclassified Rhizobium]